MIYSRAKQVRLDYQQRIGRDVTVSEVARAIGVSKSALSQAEKRDAKLSREMLDRLCKFYGVTPGDLLEYVEDEPSGNDVPLRLAA